MIDFEVYLSKYDWIVRVIFLVDYSMLGDLAVEIRENFNRPMAIKMRKTLYKNLDTGFTCTNPSRHLSYMIINNASTIAEFLDTFTHEKNHVEMHICDEMDIDPFSEEASYLSGNLVKAIYLAIIDNLK